MKVLVDMNLSPRWITLLQAMEVEACHWSTVGSHTAPDEEVLRWAAVNRQVLLTHDLDFGAVLAFSGAVTPSVIQIRSDDLRPELLAPRIAAVLRQIAKALTDGALVTIEPGRERVRLLPLRPTPSS